MNRTITLFALMTFALLSAKCGSPSSHKEETPSSSTSSWHNKKYYVLACDGAVFDDRDPFGKRVTFAREGTKKFEKTSDFVISNETTEYRSIVADMAVDCTNGANKIPGFVANICGQINAVNPSLSFFTLYSEFGGVIYKGSYSCNLKEKSK